MKKFLLLLMFAVAANAAKVDLKTKIQKDENVYGLPSEDIPGFDVKNINEDSTSLLIDATLKAKTLKLGELKVKPSTKFKLDYFLETDVDTEASNVFNRDGSSKGLKQLDLSQSFLGFKKLAKAFVAFAEFKVTYSDGHTLEYNLLDSKYYLLRTERLHYLSQIGIQKKLSKSFRLNARYSLSLFDYKHDYSSYAANSGESNDKLSQVANVTLISKLNKKDSLELDLKYTSARYKNKLALNKQGFVITNGSVEQEDLFEYAAKLSYKLKFKQAVTELSSSYLKKEDEISGARNSENLGLSFNQKIDLSKKLKLALNYSYNSEKHSNMIASITDITDPEKLRSHSNNYQLSLKYKISKFEVELYAKDQNTNSTRRYDKVESQIYGLGMSSKF